MPAAPPDDAGDAGDGEVVRPVLTAGRRRQLVDVLSEGQRRGLLGPGPVAAQLDHALAVGSAVASAVIVSPGSGRGPSGPGGHIRALDLGTGGGIPGLVLACALPDTRWVLLDSRSRSAGFVEEAIAGLGLEGRAVSLLGRAEEVGRDPAHRGQYDVVVARGFGPPAVTAECGAPLLRIGGILVVTEPPGGDPDRWPAGPLAGLGLRRRPGLHQRTAVAVLEVVESVPSTYPRRVGVPAKRPLFSVSRETETGT